MSKPIGLLLAEEHYRMLKEWGNLQKTFAPLPTLTIDDQRDKALDAVVNGLERSIAASDLAIREGVNGKA